MRYYSVAVGLILASIILLSCASATTTYIVSYYSPWLSDLSSDDLFHAVHDYTRGSIGTTTTSYVGIYTSSTTNKYSNIQRSGLQFDTSSIPDGDTVTNVTLCLWISEIEETLGDTPDLIVTDFEPIDYVTWSSDDYYYIHWGGSSYGTAEFSALSLNQYNNITLFGFSVNKVGNTTLGLMENHDFYNSEPAWSKSNNNHIRYQSAIGAHEPVLIVEHSTITPTPSNATISINLLEKYSNAALVGQSVTLTPTTGGSGETKTSTYGETLHFDVINGLTYWINASRSGYEDYNETYTITSSSGIYNVYMERILTPIANHSYAHFSVVDQTNGGLIPNAEIRLSDGQTKLTNSAGYAWFSVNNSEQINYYVSKPSGYWPAYGAMNLTADESILVALQRYTGPTATATMPGWTPVTVPTTGTGVDPVVTLSAQLRQQNVQEGMDVWYTNLPFISQFLFLLFIIGGLGLMAGGTRRN